MDFAAVAHDLRAPLTAMLGHTQLLAVEGLSDTGRRRLQVMESQIRRMVTLIERCMPQLEQSSRHAAPLDVTETIDDVVAELDANVRATPHPGDGQPRHGRPLRDGRSR
jgi:signal transduction histidine kinase